MGIDAKIRERKLKVVTTVQTDKLGLLQALMPDRELSAMLPRCILLADKKQAPVELLQTIAVMVKRMALGRTVRVWKYQEDYYFSFISWREVCFAPE